MQTNPAVEQSKIVRWFESPCNQSGRKGKGLLRKGFAKELSLKFRQRRQHSYTYELEARTMKTDRQTECTQYV